MKVNYLLALAASCVFFASCGGGETEGEQYYDQEQTEAAVEGGESPVDQTKIGADANVDDLNEEAAVATEAGSFEKGAKLIAMSDCLSCHQEDKKLVGPGYAEVAGKYEFNDKNVDYLATKIIEGGSGVWGQVPMTPHPDISREDAREMAKYILAIHKE